MVQRSRSVGAGVWFLRELLDKFGRWLKLVNGSVSILVEGRGGGVVESCEGTRVLRWKSRCIVIVVWMYVQLGTST